MKHVFVLVLLSVVGCETKSHGEPHPIQDPDGSVTVLDSGVHIKDINDGGAGPDDGAVVTSDSGLTDTDASTGHEGPRVYLHMAGTTGTIPHSDGLAGQTPATYIVGVRSFQLLRSLDDSSPVTVFDHGDDFVEANLIDNDTVVGSIAVADLPADHFTYGRTVYTHVTYEIDATLHNVGLTFPGTYNNTVVLSDRTTLDGQEHNRGWYSFLFRTGGSEFPLMGDGYYVADELGPLFTVRIEHGETAVYFTYDITTDPSRPTDIHIVSTFNMHEAMRWTDLNTYGYTAGVYDVTLAGGEPISQFGPNSWNVIWE